jgi:hypothetical protein
LENGAETGNIDFGLVFVVVSNGNLDDIIICKSIQIDFSFVKAAQILKVQPLEIQPDPFPIA